MSTLPNRSELENTKQDLNSQRSNSAHALASSLGLKDKVSSLQGQLQAIRDKEDMVGAWRDI